MTSRTAIHMRPAESGVEVEGQGAPVDASTEASSATADWSLVREIGIEYAEPAQDPGELPLRHPVLIEPAGGGRHLIVDEIGLEKARTVRIECRTFVVDDCSRILFDSHALGVEDGYGCSWCRAIAAFGASRREMRTCGRRPSRTGRPPAAP